MICSYHKYFCITLRKIGIIVIIEGKYSSINFFMHEKYENIHLKNAFLIAKMHTENP